MKTCAKCKEVKPLEEGFHKNKKTKDGYLGTCKVCRIKEQRTYRKSGKGRTKDNRYNNSPKRYKRLYDYWGKFPEKKYCQDVIGRALRDSKIVRPCYCEACKTTCKPEAHHWKYSKVFALDVFWLCKDCHVREHKYIKELGYKDIKGLYLMDHNEHDKEVSY